MSLRTLVEHILEQRTFAVCGVSRDRDKYGYKVYRSLKLAGYKVYAVNPNADMIDSDPCYPSLDNIPAEVDCVVTVTKPEVTDEVIGVAGRLRIPLLWMQPGSEAGGSYNLAVSKGIQVVHGGPCIMVAIKARRSRTQ